MAYVVVDDFKLGMDRRKQRISGAAGALWEGINGHITRGGEFERRKKFVKKYALPAGTTFGLAQFQKQIFVFGQQSNPGIMPAGVSYIPCAHPSNVAMYQIIDNTTFSGSFYTVARFVDGAIFHYLGGTRVTAWDAIANGIASNSTVAAALAAQIDLDPRYTASALGAVVTIQAAIAGTPFTLSSSVTGSQTITLATPQANVTDTPEVRASLSFSITGGPGGDLEINASGPGGSGGSGVSWILSDENTAASCAALINTFFGGNFSLFATVAGNTVTVEVPAGYGASGDLAFTFAIATIGGLTINYNGMNFVNTSVGMAFMGGANEIPAVSQVETATIGGAFVAGNIFQLTLDGLNYVTTGTGSGMGVTALTYQGKEYSVTTSLLEFSDINDASTWNGTGSGFINMTNQNDDNDALVGARQYQDRIAIFSRQNIQIWVIAVDPSQNTFQQSVENTGALSIRSIQQYGNIDVFYLNDSGVRSLRARDASNAPAVNDVGVAIDPFIQEWIATLTGAQIARACSVIEPIDGRYWLALHNRIFVYSFFPGSKISAWTYYDLSDEIGAIDITDMVKVGNRVYIRAGDTIYLYGGDNNAVYPNAGEILCTASTGFLSANKPATIKEVTGFDMGMTGTWKVTLLPLPSDDTVELEVGTYFKPTYSMQANPIQMPCSLFAIKMVASQAGPAVISNFAVHFNSGEDG